LNAPENSPTPQSDWIQIERGDPIQIRKAVSDYSSLFQGREASSFEAVIGSHVDGFFVLSFPRPIPAYNFVNLIGWLNAPPDIAGVSGARGWFRAPGSGERFALYPDVSNPWGDTLLGYGATDRKIEVYQPEAWICETTKQIRRTAEPSLGPDQVKELARFELICDTDPSFGNPTFQITHPVDTDWNA
jgi:hypothetical protein